MTDHPLKQAIENVAKECESDVYLYAGSINKSTSDQLIDMCADRPRRRASLVLSTSGGDPHSAYRLTRHLQNNYEELTLLVPSVCKSAGTLIALGVDTLVLSNHGELGPLDVQVREREELWEFRSGLIPITALELLQEQTFDFFMHRFFEISSYRLTTKVATDIASQLAIGLFSQLSSQIDPLRIADTRLSMRVAEEYGRRLDKGHAKPNAIHKLVYTYPSHSFVLDGKEASDLFDNVRSPTDAEAELFNQLEEMIDKALTDRPIALYLSGEKFLDALPQQEDQDQDEEDTDNGQVETEREHGEDSSVETEGETTDGDDIKGDIDP